MVSITVVLAKTGNAPRGAGAASRALDFVVSQSTFTELLGSLMYFAELGFNLLKCLRQSSRPSSTPQTVSLLANQMGCCTSLDELGPRKLVLLPSVRRLLDGLQLRRFE